MTVDGTGRTREHVGMTPLDDPEKAIEREVEVVAQHFPDADPTVVAGTVHEVVDDLRADAEIETHVPALTRHWAYDRLRAKGEVFQAPTIEDVGPETESEDEATPDPTDPMAPVVNATVGFETADADETNSAGPD
jgi:hypothetical protein